MKSISLICWCALVIVSFTEGVKSTSNIDVVETNYRLPNDTYPEHYKIELTTNVHAKIYKFQGKVTIDIVVVSATNKIVLHAHNLLVSKATIEDPFTGEYEDLLFEYDYARKLLTLRRTNDEELLAEKKWKLIIIYKSNLRFDNSGFYYSKYKHNDGNDHHFAATKFSYTNARSAFPCYDEPNKRANFTITINHSPTYTAISNMPVNNNLSSPSQTVFLTTPSMPTYMVAFTVFDFEYTEHIDNNLTQRIYFPPNAKNRYEEFLPKTSKILNYLSDSFDVAYTRMIPKMDYVAVRHIYKNALENWGLIMYRDEMTSRLNFKYLAALDMAQAIVHQWFGNYVTVSSFAYLWIMESIADLYGNKVLGHIYPEWNVRDFYETDAYDTTWYMHNDETHFRQRMSYILRMWNNALTDRVFQKGLHNFLKLNQYKAVGEEELYNSLQVAVKEENHEIPATINEMISTWTKQKGYPILTVSRNYIDGTFTVKQENYYNNETVRDSKTWYVPINYAVASNPNFSDTKATHYLRNVTETTFIDAKILNNDWLILNKQSIFYYRVNYDAKNWNLIIESLIENPFIIDYHTRAQLLRDAIALWKSNRLDVSILIKLFTYMKKEDNWLCWYELLNFLSEVYTHLRTNVKYDDLQLFFAEQLSPIYEKLRLIDGTHASHYQISLRFIINEMARIIDLNKSMEDDFNRLKNRVADNTLLRCNAIKIADDDLFDTFYQQLIDKEYLFTKSYIIEALSCHRNINLIKKLLRITIDKSIDLDEFYRYYILKNIVIRSHMTFSATIEFLRENWNALDNLLTNTKNHNLNKLITDIASTTHNKYQEDQLLTLVNQIKNSEHASPNLELEVKNIVTNNLKLAKKYEEILPPISAITSQLV